MYSLLSLIDSIVDLYCFTLIAYVVVTWLVTFNIINPWQPLTRSIIKGLSRLHDPALDWIRSVVPSLGGLDISPVILLLAIQFARNLLFELIA
jgi:YggT family protein